MLKRSLVRLYSVAKEQPQKILQETRVASENGGNRKLGDLIVKNIEHRANKPTPFKPFAPNSFVSPYDFTYKGHTKKDPPRLLADYLAPSRKEARAQDPFYQLNLDPLDFALNPVILQAYMTDMGKIWPRTRTRLTTKNQRRLGKAIRRAKMMGIIPMFSKRDIFS